MSAEYNPFTEISQKLDRVLSRIDALENKAKAPTKIALPDFCKQQGISRPTAYAWADKGLVQMERIGGRQFINADSVRIAGKYQREQSFK